MKDVRTPRQRVFGVFARRDAGEHVREVSPSRSIISTPRDPVYYARDVAPRRPHTMSVYQRPRNDEQLPRWLRHRTSDNWSPPSYVYSPVRGGVRAGASLPLRPGTQADRHRTAGSQGISAKCHFAVSSPFHWQPPPRPVSLSPLCAPMGPSTPRGFDVPLSSPFASAHSSPRLRSAWAASRQGSEDMGDTGRDYLFIQTPPSTAGSGAMAWRRPG